MLLEKIHWAQSGGSVRNDEMVTTLMEEARLGLSEEKTKECIQKVIEKVKALVLKTKI